MPRKKETKERKTEVQKYHQLYNRSTKVLPVLFIVQYLGELQVRSQRPNCNINKSPALLSLWYSISSVIESKLCLCET